MKPEHKFRLIPGYEPYEISQSGILRVNKILLSTPVAKRTGYRRKYLKLISKNINIHRAVALAFIPNISNLPAVNHIDGNKLNNHVSNLEWCSYKQNMRHAVDTGLKAPLKGEQHGHAKLNESAVRIIKDAISIGYSGRSIARYFKVSQYCISAISRGLTWRHL